MSFTMAEAAKKLGVSVSLIRRYEREFNLQFQRDEQGRGLLSDQDIANVKIIRAYRQQNVPVDEIRAMLLRPVPSETTTVGPDVKEVLAAIVSRQDELERIVQAQGAAIQQLTEENLRLKAANDQFVLQLEAPKDQGLVNELGGRVADLEARAKASEEALDAATKDEMIRKLQRRLLDLEAAVATELGEHRDDDDEGILDELARAIQAQSALPPRKWWQLWR